MHGVDLVVSALGITRQADGLDYRDVDYQANLNLLAEARRAGVPRFAHVHVLNANRMEEMPMVAANVAFVRALQQAVPDIASTVADAMAEERAWLDVGGPDTYRRRDLAQLAFDAIGKPARITRLPDGLRRAALVVLPRITLRRIHGPAQFFLTAFGFDMGGEPHGSRRLEAYFAEIAAKGRW